MFPKTFWRGLNVFLFLLVIFISFIQVECDRDRPTDTTAAPRTTKKETERPDKSTDESDDKYPKKGRNSNEHRSDDSSGDSKKHSNKKKYDHKYGQDLVGDYSKDSDRSDRGRYRDRDYHNKGIDPDTYGQDLADRKDIYEDKDLMVASLYVWVRHADDWDRPDKHPYRPNRYNKNRYGKDSKKKKYSKDNDYKGKDKDYKGKDNDYKGKDKDYKGKDDDYKGKDDDYKGKDDDYKGKDKDYKGRDKNYRKKDDRYKGKDSDSDEGYKRKDKYKKVTFPVRVYKSYKKYPQKRLPTLFNALPWAPIFYDKLTYQTFIYCPTGHFLILPPLINFFGQRFAVAQLIKWGYASLVSSGVGPGPGFNALPLVQQPGAPGAPVPPGTPFDPNSGQFNGGVTTNFGQFRPQG